MDGLDWLSYTAVTPRASLQSDANNNDNNDDNNGNGSVILSARGGNGGNSHIMPLIA